MQNPRADGMEFPPSNSNGGNVRAITVDALPSPKGHYAYCIEHNGLLFISGQLPVDDRGVIPDGIEAQTALVLRKLDEILLAAGSARDRVLRLRVYISDISLWDTVNAHCAAYFATHRPARCIVPVGPLHHGCLIEIEADTAL
ncbi:MAG TPA: RidA family protein [Bacteroidota bacterium]|nr:RidA family protein [Bacteroidota bacterium]